MLKKTYVSTIAPGTSAAEFLSIRAAWGGQDRLAPPAVPRRAVLRHAGLPGIHRVARLAAASWRADSSGSKGVGGSGRSLTRAGTAQRGPSPHRVAAATVCIDRIERTKIARPGHQPARRPRGDAPYASTNGVGTGQGLRFKARRAFRLPADGLYQ